MERSHSGLVRWFAKPVKESNPFEGSNPSLSAIKFDDHEQSEEVGKLYCRVSGVEESLPTSNVKASEGSEIIGSA